MASTIHKIYNIPSKIKTFGNSMYPLLQDEDIVEIKKIEFSKIKLDDVICIKKRNRFITHRVVHKNKDHVITKGDHNLYSDGEIKDHEVVGIVKRFMRNGERFYLDDFYLLQSTSYFQEIVKVKKALKKAKINFVILKGLPIHLFYNNAHPRRIYADCDILISKGKLAKLIKVFRHLNYDYINNNLANKLAKHKLNELEISFSKTVNQLNVEFDVHFSAVFTTLISGNPDAFYSQRLIEKLSTKLLKEKVTIKVSGETFPVLSKENLFLYSAMHIFHHKFKPSHRYDLLRSLVKKDLNYDKISSTIDRFNLKNFLYPCFVLYNKNYSPVIPASFMAKIKPSQDVINFTEEKIIPLSIFDEQITDQRKKTQYLFSLSPAPIYKKLSFFLDPWVFLYAILVMFSNLFNRNIQNENK